MHTSPKPDRSERLADIFKRSLSPLLQDKAPLGSLVTLTNISTDEKGTYAKILVTVLPENKEDEVLNNLKKAVPEFRHNLADLLNLRSVPELQFIVDKGEKSRERIESLRRENS